MKTFLSKIRHAGIDSDTDQSDIKCITLTNTVAFLLMLLASGYIPLFLFYLPATEYITYVFIIDAGLNFGVVILNYYRKYTLSVIFFASFSLIFLIISSIILGRESNFHYFIICSLYLIFFAFPPHKKQIMYLFISLFIVSFKAESQLDGQSLIDKAFDVLKNNNYDLIVANNINPKNTNQGFRADKKQVHIIDKEKTVISTGLKEKDSIASIIVDKIKKMLSF